VAQRDVGRSQDTVCRRKKVYLETEKCALWNSCEPVHNFSKAIGDDFPKTQLWDVDDGRR
jgi:hypothetical protein